MAAGTTWSGGALNRGRAEAGGLNCWTSPTPLPVEQRANPPIDQLWSSSTASHRTDLAWTPMHTLPPGAWPAYLGDVSRVLAQGGVFELWLTGSVVARK